MATSSFTCFDIVLECCFCGAWYVVYVPCGLGVWWWGYSVGVSVVGWLALIVLLFAWGDMQSL